MYRIRHNIVGLVALLSLLGSGCTKSEHPPTYRAASKAEPEDAGFQIPIDVYDASVPPPEDMTGLCGNQILHPLSAQPNLYLVLDRSGSMRDLMQDPKTGKTIEKYSGSLLAIHDVLFALGHRVAYGAAVFPRFGNIRTCDPGSEVYAVTAGDSVTWARSGQDGPNLTKIMKALDRYVPEGATPTSATLETLVEPLVALGGDTSVILATDGAPNCNESITCGIAECIPNIESYLLSDGTVCDTRFNCCDYLPGNCIDVDASAAPVAELSSRNIKTYVIGLPGSEVYQTVLNRLATAGGTARTQPKPTDPIYYPVTDVAQLTDALVGIMAAISISCTVPLDAAPPDWSLVNVYFDNALIKMNPEDGWKQIDAHTLEVTGSHCELLRSGDVFQVQVVAGCPTEVLL